MLIGTFTLLPIVFHKMAAVATHTQPAVTGAPQAAQVDVAHEGHESMHSAMFMMLVLALVATNFGVFQWRARHPRSFLAATLLGLWLFPAILAAAVLHFRRFLFLWLLFSLASGRIVRRAFARPVARDTPRRVYGTLRSALPCRC